jgi:hypothetical protein
MPHAIHPNQKLAPRATLLLCVYESQGMFGAPRSRPLWGFCQAVVVLRSWMAMGPGELGEPGGSAAPPAVFLELGAKPQVARWQPVERLALAESRVAGS